MMNHPSKIEDWSTEQLDYLERLINNECREFGVTVYGIYIVGSLVFGRAEVNDIDIAVHCEKIYSRKQEANFRRQINQKTSWKLDIKFRYDWDSGSHRCDLGFMIPFYDLTNRNLMYKVPYDEIPFNFAYLRDANGEIDTSVMIAYDRSKNFRIKKLLKLTLKKH